MKATGRGISAPPGLKAFTFELLLQTSVKRRSLASAASQPRPENGASAIVTDPHNGDATHRRGGSEVGRLRLPFWIQFCAAPVDRTAWEAVLMDVSGGHTAALVVEVGEPSEAAPLRLRVFKTVPLLSEEEANDQDFRVIGYGCSS